MRMTIQIADDLHESARLRAKERGITLEALVEDALRRELRANHKATDRPSISIFRGGNGLRPGVDISSNRAICELLDEGLPFEKLR
jgi:hypothetical protein